MFYVPTYFLDPIPLFLQPYAGYLHVGTRAMVYLERIVSPLHAPIVGAIVSLAVTASVAAFLASDRLAGVLPRRWQRFALGFWVIAAPGVYETLGIDAAVQTYLSVYLLGLALAAPAHTRSGRLLDRAGALVASLTGPFSLLFAPIFWQRRSSLAPLVTAGGLVQLVTLLSAPSRPWILPSPVVLIEIVALRTNAAVLGSTLGTIVPAALAVILLAALIFIAAKALALQSIAPIVFAAGTVAVGGILVTGPPLMEGARAGERFFFISGLAAVTIVIAGVAARNPLARVSARLLAVLLVAGLLIDLRVPAHPDSSWSEVSGCIGAPTPCHIEVYPSHFSFLWPGADGTYQVPLRAPRVDD